MAWDDDRKDRERSGGQRYAPDRERGPGERAGDEVRSWFGDEEAERRRRQDAYDRGRYWGRGDDYERRTYGRGWPRSDQIERSDYPERYGDYDYDRGDWDDRGPGAYPGDYYNRGPGWFGRGFGLGLGAGFGPGYGRPFGPDYGTDFRDVGYGGTGSDLTDLDGVPRYARGRFGPGPHTGRGPEGYQRASERILEDVNDNLTLHGRVDASNIRVSVDGGEVTLEGTVDSRRAKRMAEDAAEAVRGVRDVHNRLRIERGAEAGER